MNDMFTAEQPAVIDLKDATWRTWVDVHLALRGMTKTRLAEVLGCSRTTLWKSLDSEDGNGLRERIVEVLTP